jgi:hypothetical protein
MDYQKEFIVDFARRTRANLEFIERAADPSVYEVTQLFNSMLGLLVFPQQSYMDRIPETSLHDLVNSGWPAIKVIKGSPSFDNLRQLIRMLRNGVSHCNVEFMADDMKQITGLRIWNHEGGNRRNGKNWEAELSIEDLRTIAFKFIELMESEVNTQ